MHRAPQSRSLARRPLGVLAAGWKAPTEEERAHDYLWRIHAKMPAAGQIVVFNRSHYEDVLVPPVSGWITPAQTAQRYAQINDFERMLWENGTTIVKFMLHISKDEQRKRLQERVDDPTKHWKFSLGDLETRKQWDAYQGAYGNAPAGVTWAGWVRSFQHFAESILGFSGRDAHGGSSSAWPF